jgi:hydroxylamine reductase
MDKMFCRQCEQTAGGKGCALAGICGKTPETAVLQDLLIYILKGLAFYGYRLRQKQAGDKKIDRFVMEALFATVTNVDFNPKEITKLIYRTSQYKEELYRLYEEKCEKISAEKLPETAQFKPPADYGELIKQAKRAGILANPNLNEDIRSLQEILLYGLKGMASYADHAQILGSENEEVTSWFYKGLDALNNDKASADELINLIMEFGKVNLKCLEILDRVHTSRYGHPEPTKVLLGTKKGPAIAVSGHDLYDLEQLLEQSKDSGVNVYTHGEMLPAHAYPKLKKYSHLAGHFGSAWQNQQKEFALFPGAVLMTTNCIQQPAKSYKDNIFTTGLVRWPGVKHIKASNDKKDFTAVIERAKKMKGYEKNLPDKEITVGFARNAVLGVADKIITAVKAGKIKHFFLVGGCDGAKPGRNYFTEFVSKTPKDTVVLTLACGKFRFNTMDLGDIDGIPRLLDMGQCNDAYSAIAVAGELAKAFNCSVNELPLSFVLSWYEQKAVCILLTLFSLGIKNIRLGPSLPAFVSPNVLKVLVDKFNIMPIGTPEADLKSILAAAVKK